MIKWAKYSAAETLLVGLAAVQRTEQNRGAHATSQSRVWWKPPVTVCIGGGLQHGDQTWWPQEDNTYMEYLVTTE